MRQALLPFNWPAAEQDRDFIVTPSNQGAVRLLEHVSAWPVMACVLVGPRKSGRSLLARIFCSNHAGDMIDDAESVREVDIFHAWNRAQEYRRPLIIVADFPSPEWLIRLPDLRSRMGATPVARIGAPDDSLTDALIEKLLLQRGIRTTQKFRNFVINRIERSHFAIIRFTDLVEELCQLRGEKATLDVAKDALMKMGMIDPPLL